MVHAFDLAYRRVEPVHDILVRVYAIDKGTSSSPPNGHWIRHIEIGYNISSDSCVHETSTLNNIIMSSTSTTTLLANDEAHLALSVRASTEPLVPTGVLDKYEHVDLTPVIGREYPNVQLTDLLKAENADELIRELAIISQCQPRLYSGGRS